MTSLFTATRFGATVALGAIALLLPTIGARAAVTIDGTYMSNSVTNCHNANSCELNFTPVPAGKVLLVKQVSCIIIMPSTAKISNLQAGRKLTGGFSGFQFLTPVQEMSDAGGKKHYSLNVATMIALAAGEKFGVILSLRANAAGVIQFTCTIHGTLSEPR